MYDVEGGRISRLCAVLRGRWAPCQWLPGCHTVVFYCGAVGEAAMWAKPHLGTQKHRFDSRTSRLTCTRPTIYHRPARASLATQKGKGRGGAARPDILMDPKMDIWIGFQGSGSEIMWDHRSGYAVLRRDPHGFIGGGTGGGGTGAPCPPLNRQGGHRWPSAPP